MNSWGLFVALLFWSCFCHLGWQQVHAGEAEQSRLLREKELSGVPEQEGSQRG